MGIIELLESDNSLELTCQKDTPIIGKLPRTQRSHLIEIDLLMSSESSDSTDLDAREKCGESSLPLPSSERPLDNCLPFQRQTQEDSSKVMPSSAELSDSASSRRTKDSSITSS